MFTCQGLVGFSLFSDNHATLTTEYSCAQRASDVFIRLTLAGSVITRQGLSALRGV